MSKKFLSSSRRHVHTLVCMARFSSAHRTEKGAMNMTERYPAARSADPSQQDVDDLIFLGQTGPQVSQR